MTNQELLTRGVAKVIPQKLAEEKLNSGKKIRVYLGIDPTGARLHIGHSVQLRKLRQFADAGHDVIFVIGSYTATIGDPTGRDAMREPLTIEQVKQNFQDYKKQAEKILDFKKVKIAYNHEWLEKLKFDDIIQLASNFTVQQMLEREMFVRRMEPRAKCPECGHIIRASDLQKIEDERKLLASAATPCPNCNKVVNLSFRADKSEPVFLHEFFYPLMVGYDSVMLDVDCETGGTDQEFNMLAGRTLQTAMGKRDKFVLTNKLIEGTDGRKMSKTYDNCIYLIDEPKDMYGKTLSIKDDLILEYMECCTDIPMEEIAEAEKAMKKGANPKDFKMRLAREFVTMYHSEKAAQEAEAEFGNVFAKGGVPDDMPEVKAEKGELLIDLLVRAKIVASKSEARRLIDQKAVSIVDGNTIETHDRPAETGIVKVGKRKFVRII
jgi:tyrosyl-tRNA synthetase